MLRTQDLLSCSSDARWAARIATSGPCAKVMQGDDPWAAKTRAAPARICQERKLSPASSAIACSVVARCMRRLRLDWASGAGRARSEERGPLGA